MKRTLVLIAALALVLGAAVAVLFWGISSDQLLTESPPLVEKPAPAPAITAKPKPPPAARARPRPPAKLAPLAENGAGTLLRPGKLNGQFLGGLASKSDALSEGRGRPDLSRVDAMLEQMALASIAFNAPTKINIGETAQIRLLLSLEESIEELQGFIHQEGAKTGASIKVSDRMEARLTGRRFQIDAITDEVQAVSGQQRTEWIWDVYPVSEGRHRLHLTLSALLDVNGKTTPRTIRTFSRLIEVEVTPAQKAVRFLEGNWQWLWGALVIPILGWLWKRKKSRPKRLGQDGAGPEAPPKE